jgi:hypothetical protein
MDSILRMEEKVEDLILRMGEFGWPKNKPNKNAQKRAGSPYIKPKEESSSESEEEEKEKKKKKDKKRDKKERESRPKTKGKEDKRDRSRTPSRGRSQSPGNRNCYNCGKPGHFISECPRIQMMEAMYAMRQPPMNMGYYAYPGHSPQAPPLGTLPRHMVAPPGKPLRQ